MQSAFIDECNGRCNRLAQVTPANIFDAIAI